MTHFVARRLRGDVLGLPHASWDHTPPSAPFQLSIALDRRSVFLLATSFTLADASCERGASESLTQTQCGRPHWWLPPQRSWRWSPSRGGRQPSPLRPCRWPARHRHGLFNSSPAESCSTWLVCVCVCGLRWLFTWLTWGGGQRLKIKCAQREWPGRCWAGWPCRPWWCSGPGE